MPNKFEPASWVNAGAALNTVATRLSLFMGPGGADETAMSVLGRAIISGEIPACLSGEKAARKADYWETVGADWGIFPPFNDIDLHRLGLAAWLTRHEPKIISDRSLGRTATFDWDAAWIAMCVHIHVHGLPAKQADLERAMLDWFAATYDGQEPGISTVKAKVKMLFDAFRKAGN
jgi:hypothetical protein